MKSSTRYTAICTMIFASSVSAQDAPRSDAGLVVGYTLAHIDQCTQADELLRSACDRIGKYLPNEHKQHCELPAATFNARTKDALHTFKQANTEDIRRNEQKIATLIAQSRRDFDQRFANVRSGKVSMLDLESLSRILASDCAQTSGSWLSLSRKP